MNKRSEYEKGRRQIAAKIIRFARIQRKNSIELADECDGVDQYALKVRASGMKKIIDYILMTTYADTL